MKVKNNKGFTLLELLIVTGILAILATVAIMAINPAELLKRSRDSSRISDIGTLKRAIAIAQNDNSNLSLGTCDGTKVYASVSSETPLSSEALLPSGITFIQVSRENLQKTDGSGWIPINFQGLAIGSPLGSLPIDPLNTHNSANPARSFFFTYACNTQGQYELNAKLESNYYGFKDRDGFPIDNPAQNPLPLTDGGDNGLYETGTSLAIIPKGSQCPNGMVWVPSPGNFCIDAYEATYSASGVTVASTTCSSDCPLSQYNQSPWTSVQAPAPSQTQAITFCQNMGKVLPTDFEWWLASTGTPDPYTSAPTAGTEPCQIWNSGAWCAYSNRKPDGSVWANDKGWGACTAAIKTGTASQCESTVGAYDMVGNVWEWVNDTKNTSDVYSSGNTQVPATNQTIAQINALGVPIASGGTSCSGGKCNSDYYWVTSGSLTAGLRSGYWLTGADAGRFALHLTNASGYTGGDIGFRCALR
jgi:prepilin-type N-terminal cleavage/methylation domain-containing protein